MKKILLIASVLFSAVLGFTACSSDDDDYSNYNLSSDCGAAVAKTYNGTWTRTLGDEETVTSSSSITLAGTDKPHVVSITIPANDEIKMASYTVPANITQLSETRYAITLPASSNTFVTTTGMRAYVDNGELIMDFIMSVKVGRKNYEYSYHFVGK